MESIRFPPSRSAVHARRALATALLAALLGCSGKDPYSPGTKLGTFHVTAKLTQSTCGETPNPWEFDVRINQEGTSIYWIQGGAPIQGSVDAAARTELKAETVYEVRPADAKAKLPACSIARSDALTVTLAGADAKPAIDPSLTASFVGGLVYTFTPTEGSDCSDQLVTVGGTYPTLPCDVRYDLSGTHALSPP